LQITLRDIERSEALEDRIRRSVRRLERFYPAIVGCRVVVEAPHHHQRQGRLYTVRLDLRIPGGEIVIDRDHDEDVYVALRDAFDGARRQLEERVERRRDLARRGRATRAVVLPERGGDE